MKGDLHNIDAIDRIKQKATAAFTDPAPKLLDTSFRDISEASCEATACDCDDGCNCEIDHPIIDLCYPWNDDGDTPGLKSAGIAPSLGGSGSAGELPGTSNDIDDSAGQTSLLRDSFEGSNGWSPAAGATNQAAVAADGGNPLVVSRADPRG